MSLIPKRGTVYVVDDDEAVRDSLQWLLEGKDYRVKCFDSAESFLARFDPREVGRWALSIASAAFLSRLRTTCSIRIGSTISGGSRCAT